MKIINKTNLISNFFFILFLTLCVLYFFACNDYFVNLKELTNYSNIHDHKIYLDSMDQIKDGNILLSINNDFGIAFIYIYITKFFNLIGISDILTITFFFNIITLIFVFKNYLKICDKLNLNSITKYYFFLGFQFLYFTQLINKDLLTILFFTIVLKNLIEKKYLKIMFLCFLFFFVRIQLLFFGTLCVFLSFGNFRKRIILAYMFTSILGAITSVKGDLISEESMGEGLSSFLINFNNNYIYTGYLIFNPIRIILFFVDIFMSFFIYTDGLIDISKILRIPLLLALIFLIIPIFNSIKLYSRIKNSINGSIIKNVYILILSFILTWLMNPTINARYVMLIVPFLLILGKYFQIHKKQFI
jgi:hypothetical protein